MVNAEASPTITVHHGDALDVLRAMPDGSIDAVVTDPPYGLANTDADHVVETLSRWFAGERDHLPTGAGFMGKAWDAFVPPPAVWDECYRVLKPGGHLLCFAGTRTVDLMGLSIRLAGFDVRDTVTWLYGSGFPKSLDVGKAIDKAAGATREVVGTRRSPFTSAGTGVGGQARAHQSAQGYRPDGEPYPSELSVDADGYKLIPLTAPATPEAQQWHGWGTALKPASEPIVLARKPLAGTVAANVLAHGTGALNIDACRVEGPPSGLKPYTRTKGTDIYNGTQSKPDTMMGVGAEVTFTDHPAGRWPANVVLDGDAADALDEQSGVSSSVRSIRARAGSVLGNGHTHGTFVSAQDNVGGFDDSGGASRFFPVFRYQAKAPAAERPLVDGVAHPTVKPLELMRWLVRLITPPGGVVLDPFAGSGTTGEAAVREGFDAVLVERAAEYLPLIAARAARTGTPDGFTVGRQRTNPPERNTMPSKMSDKRLLTSYARATAERGRIDNRVAKAQATLDNLEQLKADAAETIATADASKAELDAQLEHLRTIARNRGVDLDAATEGSPEQSDEEPPVQADGEPVAQPAAGVPAFSQGY